ncbi:MAG: type II toxin-antitoxin system VapC family toxin [Acidobacteria bacterium]|nr:type II toxin-antitoxin system VapC family toxin [Acidobacteriota bacterium]
MPIVLDTHAWVWWVTKDRRLSKRASHAIDNAIEADGLLLSAISVWEVAKKVEKKQLVLDRPVRDWLDHARSVAGLMVAELTTAILVDSCDLPQPFHGDPADQMIVATARHHHAPLVTKDGNLRRYAHVQTVW